MWGKIWKLSEGFCVCGGLIAVGAALQMSVGGMNWSHIAYPINVILLIVFLLSLLFMFTLRQRIYFVRWAMSYYAAVPAIISAVVMTLIMGLIKQVSESAQPSDAIGLTKMLSFIPFILIYVWMATILGLISLRGIASFSWRKLPVLLNHFGLFVAMLCASLGSADMQRLTMNTRISQPEWRATDAEGNIHELPLAIELKEFFIDEYPPKLMIIDNATGQALPKDRPENIMIDDSVADSVTLYGWNISVLRRMEYAASVVGQDTVNYVEWHSLGATFAAYVKAENAKTGSIREGWVSCGSFAFPYQALRLDDKCSLVMPDREPKRFASNVMIYTESGNKIETDIEVNRPAKIEGWKIYQLSYDETKGRWSDVSVFELVKDPWLPFVYAGIAMMMLGAICMFVTAQATRPKKEEKK